MGTTTHLGRVGDSVLGGRATNVAAADLGVLVVESTLVGILGKTRVDGLALDARSETLKTTGAKVLVVAGAVVSQLGGGLALDGLTEAGVNIG